MLYWGFKSVRLPLWVLSPSYPWFFKVLSSVPYSLSLMPRSTNRRDNSPPNLPIQTQLLLHIFLPICFFRQRVLSISSSKGMPLSAALQFWIIRFKIPCRDLRQHAAIYLCHVLSYTSSTGSGLLWQATVINEGAPCWSICVWRWGLNFANKRHS